MRWQPALILCSLLLLAIPAVPAFAEDGVAVEAARRSLESAQLRLRLYAHEEHPRKLHRLEREIELAQAHVESYRRRVAEYGQFKYSSALFYSLEEARLGLLQVELKLDELEEDRHLLLRHHPARLRLFQLEVEDAAQYLEELLD